jgi:hypothetical protein
MLCYASILFAKKKYILGKNLWINTPNHAISPHFDTMTCLFLFLIAFRIIFAAFFDDKPKGVKEFLPKGLP